jgi:uncharacterized membrane protein YGL010W
MDSSSAKRHMLKYASYHRDRRNIATHFIGIPLIVFAIGVLLGHVRFALGDVGVSAAGLLWIASAIWYLTLGNLVLGLAVCAVNGVLFVLGAPVGEGTQWLTWGLSSFVVGWILQFVGHFYEGKKPAFVDDLAGLLVGPMFVVGEALFALGWGRALRADIERTVGPIVARRSH